VPFDFVAVFDVPGDFEDDFGCLAVSKVYCAIAATGDEEGVFQCAFD
jgi:hypothetical protein